MLDIPTSTILVTHYSGDDGAVERPRTQRVRSSRATRLVDDSTRFLFISFRERSVSDSHLRRQLDRWIRDGLKLEGIRYAFLGFTDQHCKEGKVIFFREDDNWTATQFLQCVGNIDSVFLSSGYGKYAARLGLSFSSTMESLDVPHAAATLVDEWRAPDGSLHSDGCGMIRDSLAIQVCKKCNIPLDTSVFQVRRGGLKGLLVRYPDRDFQNFCISGSNGTRPFRTQPPAIAYRPSMVKYEGGPTMLEINNYSRCPGPARLNTQFIILLLTLEVPLEVFKTLLLDQLDIIACILRDRETAERYIKGELDASDTNTYNQDLFALLLAKHDLHEPYVEWKLRQFQQQQYNQLRKKLSLRVEDSCYVFGVVDESGILEPDEVFVNLPGRTGVLTRDVLVGRNPSYSPGDLRKFRAVHYEELKHLKYCIVFSRKAAHSVPDTMASGDLDGDEYFVTWDPTLIPERTVAPYQRMLSATSVVNANGTQKRRTPMTTDKTAAAVDTFMQYKYNRMLRFMSSTWSNVVVATPQLANHPYAQELVPHLEAALDSMKSGADPMLLNEQFENIKQRYEITLRSQPFENPLDVLRNLIPNGQGLKITRFDCHPSLILESEDPVQWRKYFAEASVVMKQFNNALRFAIQEDKQNEGTDEGIPSLSSSSRSRPIKKADEVTQEFVARYFGGGDSEERHKQRLRASAWYVYGYEKGKQAFAWLGQRYLNDIRAHWTNQGKPVLYVGSSTFSETMHPDPTAASTRVKLESLSIQSSQTPNTDQRLHSVDTDPYPSQPVASELPHCRDSLQHLWQVSNADSTSRRYVCAACEARVEEHVAGGLWQGKRHEQSPDNGIPKNPQTDADSSSDVDSLHSDEFADALDFELPEIPGTPLTPDNTTPVSLSHQEPSPSSTWLVIRPHIPPETISWFRGLSRLFPAATSSNQNGLSPAPMGRRDQSPTTLHPTTSSTSRHPSTGTSTLIHRPSIPSTSFSAPIRHPVGLLQLTAPEAQLEPATLVSKNPKPRNPVATAAIPSCSSTSTRHQWQVGWANGSARHYRCQVCGLLHKERKQGDPLRWVAYQR